MVLVLLILKTILIAIGFSASVISDFLTFKFLKDFKISLSEEKILKTLAKISLIAILIIILILICASFYKIPIFNQQFLESGIITVFVIFLNEIFFRKIIISKLINYRLKPQIIRVKEISTLRNLAFVLNLVSIVSWFYLLLILLPLLV